MSGEIKCCGCLVSRLEEREGFQLPLPLSIYPRVGGGIHAQPLAETYAVPAIPAWPIWLGKAIALALRAKSLESNCS